MGTPIPVDVYAISRSLVIRHVHGAANGYNSNMTMLQLRSSLALLTSFFVLTVG